MGSINYQFIILALCFMRPVKSSSEVQIWKPAIVSNVSLQNETLTSERVSASIDTFCSMIASRRPWAHLFCIIDGGCSIFSLLAVPYDTGPVESPVNCMTNIDGCLDGSIMIKLNEFYCRPDDYIVYRCIAGVLIEQVHPPPKRFCPKPFENIPYYGCILTNRTGSTWCEARKQCLGHGSDLVSFENATSSDLILRFLTQTTGVTGNFLGFYGNSTNFQWVTGVPIDMAATRAMWYVGYPTATLNEFCGAASAPDPDVPDTGCLFNYDCSTSSLPFSCEIKIIN